MKVRKLQVMLKSLVKNGKNFKTVSKEAVNIIIACLKENVDERSSVSELLNHKWFDEI